MNRWPHANALRNARIGFNSSMGMLALPFNSKRKPHHTAHMNAKHWHFGMGRTAPALDSTTLHFGATRRLLQSERCFAVHDICCFMRHGCRFHCAELWPAARLLSGLVQAIRAAGQVRRRVNSPRAESPSGSSTRSALHHFFCWITPSMASLPLLNERQSRQTPPSFVRLTAGAAA